MGYKKAHEDCTAFFDTYKDEKVSATLNTISERPALNKMLNEIKLGNISTVYVYKRDRLARNVEQYLEIYDIFKRHNVKVVFTAENEPPMQYSPIHQFIELIYAGIAEQESIEIKKRIQAAKNTNIINLKYTNNKPPFGYDVIDNKLVENEEQATKLIKLFEAISITSASTLKEFCNSIQNESWYDKFFKTENIRNTIGNIRYKGYNGLLISNEEEEEYLDKIRNRKYVFNPDQVIIQEELWEVANTKLETLYNKKENKNVPSSCILDGLLFCEKCNPPLYAENEATTQPIASIRAFTVNKEKNIFVRCDTHKSNLQFASELTEIILTSISECLASLLDKNLVSLVQEAIKKQIYLNHKEQKKLEIEIERIENKINEKIMKYISNNSYEKEDIHQKDIFDLTLKKKDLLNHSNQYKYNINQLTNLQHKLHAFLRDSLKYDITIDVIFDLISKLPEHLLRRLIFNMIDKVIIWNRKLDIYLYQGYLPNKELIPK